MKRIVTFGEVMARMAPPDFLRMRQALPGKLEVTFGGAESNVAASLAMMGAEVAFVTALPKHAMADACVGSLRGLGVDTSHIVRTDQGRFGIYFLETGSNQRPSSVTYDREYSAISMTGPNRYRWDDVLNDADWLHLSGITPAVSRTAAEATIAAAEAAKAAGATVSCDLNYRKKLWRWHGGTEPRDLAERTMRSLLSHVDVVIANEEDCAVYLGIHAGATDVESGSLDTARYPDVARGVLKQFPHVSKVAITLRESVSASHNNWGAMLYDTATDEACFAPRDGDEYQPYEIRNIVDRVGGGDSFAAGLIYALCSDDYTTCADALDYAVAASCLAHSIPGDINYSTRAEIDALAGGSRSGRVVR